METLKEPSLPTIQNKKENGPILAPSSLKMRCPCCSKLFIVAHDDLFHPEPQFECVNCKSVFGARLSSFYPVDQTVETRLISKPQPVQAPATTGKVVKRVSFKEDSHEKQIECPKCQTSNSPWVQECRSCGIVFRKYLARDLELAEMEVAPGVRAQIEALWMQVQSDYKHEESHVKFLLACDKLGALAIAARRYQMLLEQNPGDERARRYREQVQALAGQKAIRSTVVEEEPRFKTRLPIPGANSILLSLGAVLFILGVFAPGLGNLTGAGAAVLMLGVGLKVYFRRPA